MKTRFNTYDILCTVTELQKLVGMRVNNVYDIDNKTYLIRLQRTEEKCVLLIESGSRFHVTGFEWPKNIAPSGFSMKMRKHLKNKRLESLSQLGTDRIVDLQFGTGEAGYHIIVELYDRGNIVLTDYEFTILYVLRPHTEGDKIKFAVREKYPQDRARNVLAMTKESLKSLLNKARSGDTLKKILVSNLEYGPAIIEHVLLKQNFSIAAKIGTDFDISVDVEKLLNAVLEAESMFEEGRKSHSKGFIIQKREERAMTADNSEKEFYYSNQEFHPFLFDQHLTSPYKEYDSFNAAVDEFFSTFESQKLELKALQQEREALKKLENVKKDHYQRIGVLEKTQEVDKQKAELITRNQELVDRAILAVQSALASQVSWADIDDMVKDAASKGDPVAKQIRQLKLEINHITLFLTDPYSGDAKSDDSDFQDREDFMPSMLVDIDLGLSAFANARRYYDQKRTAAKKQQKTIESQSKALKSAERKTKQTLKEVQTITNINKARKVYWFEKFFWFISSENYLIITGRDQQQNELIVKRYMKPADVYVHADIHGASSVVIKNPTGQPVPPKTLNEAGTMAICYSVAWEAKVVTNAYWVWGDQVSKTAPTGEYLTTGSFMVRGKKNFLPPSHLILGLSFLFRLEDSCIDKHKGERRIPNSTEDDVLSVAESEENKDEVEIEILDESDEDQIAEGDEEKQSSNIALQKRGQEEEIEDNKQTIELSNNAPPSDGASIPDNENEVDEQENQEAGDTIQFPDTHIKIKHTIGNKIEIVTESDIIPENINEDENIIYLGDNKPVIISSKQYKNRSRTNSECKGKYYKDSSKKENHEDVFKQAKRGQRSKLKKIKEKYKDQDEEERKLRMDILQSSGTGKDSRKNKKGKEIITAKNAKKNEGRVLKPSFQKDIETGAADDDEPTVQAEVDMIDALTGLPLSDDELLFAVPVVAPYNTLANYKFKVKLTPGTGRRGKAARTAVGMFLKDRAITQREKDLLKAVKDEQLARNLPGKVKLSAPRLQQFKK